MLFITSNQRQHTFLESYKFLHFFSTPQLHASGVMCFSPVLRRCKTVFSTLLYPILRPCSTRRGVQSFLFFYCTFSRVTHFFLSNEKFSYEHFREFVYRKTLFILEMFAGLPGVIFYTEIWDETAESRCKNQKLENVFALCMRLVIFPFTLPFFKYDKLKKNKQGPH